MSQTIISSLKERKKLTTSMQNMIEIMFETYFSSSLMIFMNDVKEFLYSSSTRDDELFINRKIRKIIYKTNLNKISRINKVINRTLRQLVNIVIKQIHFLFDRCIKKNIQLSHFKRIVIMILRKLDKKNYTKSNFYK